MVFSTSMAIGVREEAGFFAAMGIDAESCAIENLNAEACRLAAAVARGDETAFQELYDRYHGRLSRLVVVMSQGDEGIAQEVVQSVMLSAATTLRPVESEAHLWNWLSRVAHQHLIKEWRRVGREPKLIDLAQLSEIADAIQPETVLEEALDAALVRLEAGDRELIEWFYFDGLSHKQIAEHLSATPKAVSSRLDRARAKLRSFLTRILKHET
jgi:RNA polymerase sigma-70 factor, ECF subfamily